MIRHLSECFYGHEQTRQFCVGAKAAGGARKSGAGTKRILSGKVADTLALVMKEQPNRGRPLRIVVVNDEPGGPLSVFEFLIPRCFKDVTLLLFQDPVEAWRELSQSDPDLLITRERMAVMSGADICRRLLDRKASYPIIVFSGWKPVEECERWIRDFANRGLNVSFLAWPGDVESILAAVETALKIPRIAIKKSEEI